MLILSKSSSKLSRLTAQILITSPDIQNHLGPLVKKSKWLPRDLPFARIKASGFDSTTKQSIKGLLQKFNVLKERHSNLEQKWKLVPEAKDL